MGEIMLRGNTVMMGYLKNPEATARAFADGWFHTGDLGVRHPDGYVEVKDRSKDIIISGGENISSLEIEEILYRHPAILEAAVVAAPDEKWGEHPCAFIDLKSGMSLEEAEVIDFCRSNMAHYKVPRTVVFGPLAQDRHRQDPEIRLARTRRDASLIRHSPVTKRHIHAAARNNALICRIVACQKRPARMASYEASCLR